MSYLDVELSVEELKEDEELREAVEQIVEKAAEAIYTDIKNDVSGVYFSTRVFIETLFPFVVYWREDRSLFWADMWKVAICLVLLAWAFWILSPSPRWMKKSSSWLSFKNGKRALVNTSRASLERLHLGLRGISPFHRKRGGRPTFERSKSTSSIDYNSLRSKTEEEPEEEVETEEEKFKKRWPAVLESGYSQLVLPPECKRVAKPKNSAPRKDKHDDKSAKASKPKRGAAEADDDHPANRLGYYTKQFLHLIMSFLRYDYVGAGWTIIHWIEACLRSRKNRAMEDEDEEEDDESDADSLKRRHSISSQSSAASHLMVSPYITIRKKRASVSKREKTQRSSTTAIDESDRDTAEPIRESLAATALLTEESEEKKESASENATVAAEEDPQSSQPRPELSHVSSNSSLYETPKFDSRDNREIDPGDAVVTKILYNGRMPSSSVKTKDALETYRSRNGPSRKNASLLPPQLPSKGEPDFNGIAPLPMPQSRVESLGNSYYFETASTKEQILKMAVEVPLPDRNGYIVGDAFLPNNNWTPLLVFVNTRSGPQQGHLLITQLRGLLNPMQVWDLADGGPEEILESFSQFTRLRILVCGGDGTVSWIISAIEKLGLKRWPPIAILPLGTGNDLANIHGWGGGYNHEPLTAILEQVSGSYISWLDRWEMTVENRKGKIKKVKSFFNYMGVGTDAQAALQVHMLRESRPQLFFSRVVNKIWYGIFGAEDALKNTSQNLPYEITLIADGVEVPLPRDSQGIIFLNIDSYSGGVPMWSRGTKDGRAFGVGRGRSGSSPRSACSSSNRWGNAPLKRSKSFDAVKGLRRNPGRQPQNQQEEQESQRQSRQTAPSGSLGRVDSMDDFSSMMDLTDEEKYLRVTACDRPSSCQDGLLDVVSIRGTFHLGQIRVGLGNAQKICQCREASIVIKKKVCVQLDGEPWRQNVCTLHIKKKKEAAIMLHRSAGDSIGLETEMASVLDWAEERHLIDSTVHAALMKEFSRRIENKTRQRRVRSQDNLMISSLKRAMGSSSAASIMKLNHHHHDATTGTSSSNNNKNNIISTIRGSGSGSRNNNDNNFSNTIRSSNNNNCITGSFNKNNNYNYIDDTILRGGGGNQNGIMV